MPRLVLFGCLICLLVISGCQGPEYRPIAASPKAGATIHAQQEDDRRQIHVSVLIERVDGFFRYPGWQPKPSSTLLVDAGARTLTVVGTQRSKTRFHLDRSDVIMNVTLRAGHSYDLKAERVGDEICFWVEDSATHELAGERQSAKVKTVLGPIGGF